MYAFPQVHLPTKAVEEATKRGIQADEFYCMELLEKTGIVVVPGSGFGQEAGTYHFRTTILPSELDIEVLVGRLEIFHKEWIKKFTD